MPELTNVAMPSNDYLFIKIYHRTHAKDSNQLFCIRISTYVTGSAQRGLIAFLNSHLWSIISLQVFKLSPSYYTK